MADLISEVASRTGMSPEQTRQGLGALLAFAKEKLPAEMFDKVQSAVPDAAGLMTASESESKSESGGIMGAISSVAGKVFGGKGADLAGTFARLGLAPEMLAKFMPAVLGALKGRVPDEALNKIAGLLPAEATSGA
jgi:hypothetical protein